MKQYGANKKAEVNSKIIYKAAKEGNITIPLWYFLEAKRIGDYYGYDDNRNIERYEGNFKMVTDAIEAENYEEAQNMIDRHLTSIEADYSPKYFAKLPKMIIKANK
jgi:bisphosphoglycerate-independent phosphoglycerate mutase (AlkP superfamily)